MFCKECGKNIEEREICPYCEHGKKNEYFLVKTAKKWKYTEEIIYGKTSRFIAGILQIFAGAFGVGRFYMKSYKTALLQILTTLLTFGVGGFLWGVIDGIFILSGKTECDGNGEVMGA